MGAVAASGAASGVAMMASAVACVAALMSAVAATASVAAAATFGGFLDITELPLTGMVTLISQTFKECLTFGALRAGDNLTVFVVFKLVLF